MRLDAVGCFAVISSTAPLPADYETFKYKQFAKQSLLTKQEVIVAMVKVKGECNKVTQMSLYHMPVMKSMRLEEFEHAQSQASSQVTTATAAISTQPNDTDRQARAYTVRYVVIASNATMTGV